MTNARQYQDPGVRNCEPCERIGEHRQGKKGPTKSADQRLTADVRFTSESDQIGGVARRHKRAMYGRRPRCKRNLTYLRSVRVQPYMRPVFRVEACPVAMQPLWPLALM